MEDKLSDHYLVLGVPRYTGTEGIRRAYVTQARLHHPDLHPEDPDAAPKMSAINLAYETLSDPARRSEYDTRPVVLHVHSYSTYADPGSVPHVKTRHRACKEPSVIDIAQAFIARIVGYIAAMLPI